VKFYNATKNTIYLEDIDRYIPFTDFIQEIDSQSIKKSKSFQLLVKLGQIEIREINNERIENNLKRLQDKFFSEKKDNKEEIEMENNHEMRVNIKGHFEDQGGYAKVNRNLAFGLKSLGVDVSIENVGPPHGLNEIEIKQLASLKRKDRAKKCINIDSIVPSFSQCSSGIYNILYTTVESNTVPDQFVEAIKNYNEIWVVSDFCKKVLEKHDIGRKISVLPDSININLYQEKGDKFNFRPQLHDFIFLSVFSWSYRKGYDVLLKSYLSEFSGDEPVSLLICSRFNNNPKQDKVIHNTIRDHIKEFASGRPAHIAVCTQVIPEYLMPNLYRSCDIFSLFSRGEGFGLPYCFRAGTPIYTAKGVKNIENIDKNELVYSGHNRLRRVTEVHKNRVVTEFCKLRTLLSFEEIDVTSNHRFLAYCPKRNYKGHIKGQRNKTDSWRPEWVRAKDLTNEHLLVCPIRKRWAKKIRKIDLLKIVNNVENDQSYVWSKYSNRPNGITARTIASKVGCSIRQVYHYRHDGRVSKSISDKIDKFLSNQNIDQQIVRIPRHIDLNTDLAKLLGYYASEGSIVSDRNAVAFAFHANEKKYHDEIAKLVCKIFGLSSSLIIKENRATIVVSSRIFADICRFFIGSGAATKTIHFWIITSPIAVVRSFLNGCINGDGGSYIKANSVAYTSASYDLAKNVQYLLMSLGEPCSILQDNRDGHLGYVCRITGYRKNARSWIEKDVRKKKSKITGRIYSNRNYIFIPIVKILKYNGDFDVYNFDVNQDNSYISNIYVAHNCEASLCGLPIITTNFSGQTMFLNKGNSNLLDIDRLERIKPGRMHISFWDNEEFPLLLSDKVIQDARRLMRNVYENTNEAKAKNLKLQKFIRKNYGINSIASMAKNKLDYIWSHL